MGKSGGKRAGRKSAPPPTASPKDPVVRVDAENRRFRDQLGELELEEYRQVARTLGQIARMTWGQVIVSQGLKWEKIARPNPMGGNSNSLRVNERIRIVAYRDGEFMRMVSVHVDHDSAYR